MVVLPTVGLADILGALCKHDGRKDDYPLLTQSGDIGCYNVILPQRAECPQKDIHAHFHL
jgi:hypothetical protein